MKRIITTLSQKWPEYLLEILVLVVGIYGAFVLDNWNEERKEDKERNNIINNLHIELRDNQEELQTIQETTNKQISSLKLLMGLVGKSEEEIIQHNIDSLLYAAIDVQYYASTQHTISEISSQGQIQLIEDPELKSLIYQWQRINIEVLEVFDGLDDKIETDIVHYLMDKYPIKDIDQYGPLAWPKPSVLVVDKTLIFQDIQFENELDDLLFRSHFYQNALDELEEVQNQIINATQ